MKPASFLLPLFLLTLFTQFVPTALAGGSSAGVTETNIGNKYLVAGQADQPLLSFTVESWKSIPGDLTVQSLDITCAPAHGLTTVKLMKGETMLLSTTFAAGGVAGTQKAHFGASTVKLPNGTKTELRILVTVEKNTGDFTTACAVDSLYLKNATSGKIFSSEAQADRFNSMNKLVYVDDPLVSTSVPRDNISDSELLVSGLGLGTKDNLLMDVTINAESDIRVEDLFIFCDNGKIIERYRLEAGGKKVEPTAVQNDATTISRPEHSWDDRIVFANLGVKTGRGEGIRLKLYGDTYSYFGLSTYSRISCRVLDVRTANPLTALEEVTAQEEPLVTKVDTSLTTRLLGRILLQVETHGQAWYLDPVSAKKYYLPDGATAYQALRSFGLGITNADLAKIPASTGASGSATDARLVSKMKGRILLQVESHGEAWYVNPADGKRYYLKDGNAAYEIMRSLSVGISNTDIRKIRTGMLPVVAAAPAPAPVSVSIDCKDSISCFSSAVAAKKDAHYVGQFVMPVLEYWIPGISASSLQTWDFSTTFDGPPYLFTTTYGTITPIFAAGWFDQFLQTEEAEEIRARIDEGTYLTPEELEELESLGPEVLIRYNELVAQGKPPGDIFKEIASTSIESYLRLLLAEAVNDKRACTFSDLSAFTGVLKNWGAGNFSPEDLDFAECDSGFILE